ncbi:MAG: FtsQ-type POTRA domain-containing protein [Kiritimatiellae bacterium]|jgi:hypothetical protein|nr:FtsQ-type POTRA domain-containing protein [Kiritimatiellia bacterium]
MKLKRTAKKNKTTPSKASPKRTLRSPQERRQILIVRTIMCVFIGVVFIGSLVFSYIYLKNVLFVKNQRYVIQTIDFHSSGAFSLEKFKQYSDIDEGTNLYAFDLNEVEAKFNNKIPNVKDIELVRKLPSTLIVEIKERSPVMRLSRRSNLCVDEDGYIFAVSANKLKFLPYLSGFEYRRVRPGGKLTGRALSAVKLVTVGKSSKLALPISNVNVSPDDYIIVFLSNGKRLDIAWEEMDDNSEVSLDELEEKLMRFVAILNSPKGKKFNSYTAIDDSIYGR